MLSLLVHDIPYVEQRIGTTESPQLQALGVGQPGFQFADLLPAPAFLTSAVPRSVNEQMSYRSGHSDNSRPNLTFKSCKTRRTVRSEI